MSIRTMTPQEFRAALKAAGLRQSWLAELLGVNVATVSHWATGKAPVPQYASAYIVLYGALAEALDLCHRHLPSAVISRLKPSR